MQIPEFSQAEVMVVGDVMLDRYWIGPTSRISPEAPVPVVKIDGSDERPGGAANVALNIAALGAKVNLLGLGGDDEAAATLAKVLGAVDVDTQILPIPNMDTITKLRVLSRNQQLIRLDFEKSFESVDKTPLSRALKDKLNAQQVLVLSDYAKGCLSDAQALIKTAKDAGKKVVVDPKGSDFERYRGATLLTPNMSEFQAVVGECPDEQTIFTKANELIESLDLHALLVTRSEHGMTLVEKGQDEFHLPTIAREVYDVTGAGDTVVATLASALASGLNLRESCTLANIAAGIVVGKLGTSTVSVQELQQVMRSDAEKGLGVVTQSQLAQALNQAKSRGETIVMTNGCFDILHAGHVSYLENARKLGDRLVVAVNSDRSVKLLKGEGRPINHLDRRMAVLAGLASVDWVVDFDEDTPERLISQLLPDILVKGGDYKPEQIAGGKQVIANGGEVRVLNFEDGVSTTGIIEKIVQDKAE